MKGFMGITGHYILDWCLKSVMISCSRFRRRHVSENIHSEYEEVIASYRLTNKISYIVSDNAANMVKAFNYALSGYDLEKEEQSDDENDESDEFDDDLADDICFPKHTRCYAHTLQLVVRDGLKECGKSQKKVISKAAKIAVRVRKSLMATDVLEREERIRAANATRWNSQLIMIQSILEIPEDKMNKLEACPKLIAYEHKLLMEICEILRPFQQATVRIQADKTVSASMAIPVINGLKLFLDNVRSEYSQNLVNKLCQSLEQRMSIYTNDDTFITAAILDPRFKLTWCDGSLVENYTRSLMTKVTHCTAAPEVCFLITTFFYIY